MLVDAWFEYVAPLVGAWIEILCTLFNTLSLKSLLSWERGLKSLYDHIIAAAGRSLLSWERGLKYGYDTYGSQGIRSLLSWERGLK